MLIDARDTFNNLRHLSSTDQFRVALTGPTTLIETFAISLGNGSYSAELALEVAEAYDLSIDLVPSSGPHESILGSPLANKILIRPGVVQAVHTHLVSTFSPLTAGVNATFTIEAMDPFSNVVLNSPDKIDFVVMSRDRPSDTLVTASMEYRF